jgi:hypothetical protein
MDKKITPPEKVFWCEHNGLFEVRGRCDYRILTKCAWPRMIGAVIHGGVETGNVPCDVHVFSNPKLESAEGK